MKKRLLTFLICTMLVSACIGCGAENTTTTTTTEDTTPEQTTTTTEPPTTTEAPHEHVYTENITKEATCTEAGEKAFSCECGDTYTEQIEAIGHNYEIVADSEVLVTCTNDGKEADTKCSFCGDVISGAVIPAIAHTYEKYVYNNDATYTSDGTETAKCNTCELTDTRTAEGSKLEYTYTEMNATMYATQTVNVRNLPSTDGKKIGSLSTNQEVTVIGQCNETRWYKFDFNGQTAFVSSKYLSTEKAAAAPHTQETTQYVTGWNDMGDWFVYIHPSLEHPDLLVDGPFWEDKKAILRERYPGCNTAGPIGIILKDGASSAWMVSVGGTHSYDYPQALLDFIKVYQYKY